MFTFVFKKAHRILLDHTLVSPLVNTGNQARVMETCYLFV